MKSLYNKYDRETLTKRVDQEPYARVVLSFYRYVEIRTPHQLRDELYEEWSGMGVLGRIYLAKEGVNAQISVPAPNFEKWKKELQKRSVFRDLPLKIAVESKKQAFIKLIIKVRNRIVADGITEELNWEKRGKSLSPEEFNAAMEQEGTVVVDMRNHYESEVGHFEGAICPDAETFSEELPMVLEALKEHKEKKVLLYCTGGIRCEKASVYLKQHDFKDVNQLEGGIINYANRMKELGAPSKFIGKNFVFDDRLGEKITEDVIGKCHQCGAPCDSHTNCANVACNLLFLQCPKCSAQYEGCCTPRCQAIGRLPEHEQKQMRKGNLQKKRFNKGIKEPQKLQSLISEQKEALEQRKIAPEDWHSESE